MSIARLRILGGACAAVILFGVMAVLRHAGGLPPVDPSMSLMSDVPDPALPGSVADSSSSGFQRAPDITHRITELDRRLRRMQPGAAATAAVRRAQAGIANMEARLAAFGVTGPERASGPGPSPDRRRVAALTRQLKELLSQ